MPTPGRRCAPTLLKELLERPRGLPGPITGRVVSNDNPFSEFESRTMKYRTELPGHLRLLSSSRGMFMGRLRALVQPEITSTPASLLFAPVIRSTDGSWGETSGSTANASNRPTSKPTPNASCDRPTTPMPPAGFVGINIPRQNRTRPTPGSLTMTVGRICASGSHHFVDLGERAARLSLPECPNRPSPKCETASTV